jgi:glycosyltransferase involved in cell wall biosynthesis
MKKILVVYDEIGWCFYWHSLEIKSRLSNEYIIEMVDHRQNIPKISESFDLVYILDPMPLHYGYPPKEKTILGLRNEFLFREHSEGPLGLYEKGLAGRCVSLNRSKILHMVNKYQMEVFKDIVPKDSLMLAQHGVNSDIFDKNKYRKPHNAVLNVSVSGRNSNNKGFHTVQSACNKAGVNMISAQYGGNKLGKEQMPSFYNNADVHVCFSDSEGLNNVLLECGAMNVCPISTRSGAATEMIKDGFNGLLIDRNESALVDALNKLKDNNLRRMMADRYYEEIVANWTWDVRIDDFRKMFERFFNE